MADFFLPSVCVQEHYKDLASKPFYNKLVEYIISGPVVAMVQPPNQPHASPLRDQIWVAC